MSKTPNAFSPGISPLVDSRVDTLIKENQSLKNSLYLADASIDSADQAAQAIFRQTQSLANSKSAVGSIISGIPYIGELSNKVNVKRKKDRLILGSLIGFLMFVIVWYLFG